MKENVGSLGIIVLTDNMLVSNVKHYLLLSDFARWQPLQDEFDAWCEQNGAKREGMLVSYDDPSFIVMMKLRWI